MELNTLKFFIENGIIRKWIPRFELWPYLETYNEDVANEIAGELQGKPDLIIGNYSYGSLVSSLLSHKFGATQGFIAHALEKSKYLNSDIYWKSFEEKYPFSCHCVADLISMNQTDFIIASSFQEIAGTGEDSKDIEEEELRKMYELFDQYKLNGKFRWIAAQMNQVRNGELYRYIAGTRGPFVQAAYYEAFGLIVFDFMSCGLPTSATCHGGPAEIIVHGKSGFKILWGVPGRSTAINIAERLGLLEIIVSSARKLCGASSLEIDEVIYETENFKKDVEGYVRKARHYLMLSEDFYEKVMLAQRQLT